jgi:hypothetical protein
MNEKRTLTAHEIQHAAGRLRTQCDALIVLVIRVDDVVYSSDPRLAPKDLGETLEREIPNLVENMTEQRKRGTNYAAPGK